MKNVPRLLVRLLAPAGRLPRMVLGVCSLIVVLYYVVPAPLFGSKAQGDGLYGFYYLPALLVHGTLDMRPVMEKGPGAFDLGRDGIRINRNPIGPTLAMLPAYAALIGVEAVLRRSGSRLAPPVPFAVTNMQVFWTGLTTVAAGLFGMFLTYRLLRRHVSRGPALCGTVAAVFATPILWYLCVQPHYQHGLAFAAVALLIERWDATRGGVAPRRFLFLGVLCGLAMLMRVQEFIFLLAPGVEVLAGLVRGLRQRRLDLFRRWLTGGVLLVVGTVIGFLPQVLVWSYYFGFLRRPANVEMLRPLAPALWETLFSTRCGLLPWSPVVYLSLLGFGLACVGASREGWDRRRLLPLVVPLLVCFAADLYLVASSWMWYGAFGFGCRRLSDCAPLFGLGLALLCQRVLLVRMQGVRRGLVGGLLALLVLFLALNLALTDLARRRIIPSSGSMASPAYRWAQRAHAPAWLVRVLRHGYPFVQPAGWVFALWHHVPVVAWESVVGNYALEREPHDLRVVFGDRWDFTTDIAGDFVVEGLLDSDSFTQQLGRPVASRVRLLLQPFGREPIRGTLVGDFAQQALTVRWDGAAVHWVRTGDKVNFSVPEALVRPHRVAELTFELPGSPPPRISYLKLHSFTLWWRHDEPGRRFLPLRTMGSRDEAEP